VSDPLKKTFHIIRNIITKLFLVVLSVCLCLILLEAGLNAGYFDKIGRLSPVWIGEKYKKIDDEINAKNRAFSINNSFGFNDIERKIKKEEGAYRIAVLGDSFIWGDGVAYDVIWSHKLERKIKGYSKNIEVLSWGKRGWSTFKEFEFLKEKGVKFNPDLLIVAFVTNDLNMGDYKRKEFNFYKSNFAKPLRAIMPSSADFIGTLLDGMINQFSSEYGYEKWIKKLYAKQNLKKYEKLLIDFSDFCRVNNIKLLFVLTPSSYSPWFKKLYVYVTPLFEKVNIEYLNLYPAVVRDLSKYKLLQLRANLANNHPGGLVTEVYADEVFKYLVKNKLNKI